MEQYNRNLNSKTENAETMLQTILTECDKRQENKCTQCTDCKFGEFCPHDCEKCLEYILKMSNLVDTFLTRLHVMPHSLLRHSIFVF